MCCWTAACAQSQDFTSFADSRSIVSSKNAGWRPCGPTSTVTTTSHCSRIFAAASQLTMGGMQCCFVSVAASV